MKIVKVSKWLIQVMIFLLFLYLVYSSFRLEDFISTGTQFLREPLIIIFIFVCYFGSFYLKAIAWYLYFRKKIKISSSLFGIFYSLLINHLLPFKVGDVVRAMVLAEQEEEITVEQAFHSVFILRILDITSLTIVAGIGIIHYQSVVSFPIFFYLIAIVISIISIILVRKLYPSFFQRNLKLLLTAFSGVNGWIILSLVFISWVLEGAVLYGVAIVVKESLTPFEAVWVNSITIIGQIFQFTPGGITTYEAVMTYALSFININQGTGFMIAIYSHALKFLFSYIVGFYVYLKYPIRFGSLKNWIRLKGVKK